MTNDIDWEQVRKDGRAKIVYIAIEEVLNYCMVRHGEISMRHLAYTYSLPKEWVLGGTSLVHERRAFAFVIFSPNFVAVPAGTVIPTLYADAHGVKITREICK
jgi:hypothetical protein